MSFDCLLNTDYTGHNSDDGFIINLPPQLAIWGLDPVITPYILLCKYFEAQEEGTSVFVWSYLNSNGCLITVSCINHRIRENPRKSTTGFTNGIKTWYEVDRAHDLLVCCYLRMLALGWPAHQEDIGSATITESQGPYSQALWLVLCWNPTQWPLVQLKKLASMPHVLCRHSKAWDLKL